MRFRTSTTGLRVTAAANTLLERLDRRGRRRVAALVGAIVADTPVNTGFLRHNWRVGVNKPDLRVTAGASDPTALLVRKILSASKAQKLFITNHVHYAPYIEMGHSRKAPSGMVRLNLERIKYFPDE